jgi:F-type H+-transporting ATPase subunit a
VPPVLFPASSHIAFPLVLALISWAIFNYVGIRKQGFVGYLKNMMFPPGIPWPVYILLAPIEFLSTVIIRPITLTLRLTLNMFAGHLVLMLCMLGGAFLLSQGGVLAALSLIPFLFAIVLTFFEGFVQLLQAYVFTLLSALYVAGAESEEH